MEHHFQGIHTIPFHQEIIDQTMQHIKHNDHVTIDTRKMNRKKISRD